MLILEYKARTNQAQRAAIDEAIRTVQFIRNKALRLWMDGRGVGWAEQQRLCAVLAKEYPFAAKLHSNARQASADRAWAAISRFYENCQQKKPGKKGSPRFQHDNRSAEYVRQFTCDHIAWEQALNLGGYGEGQRLTRRRKADGTTACRQSGGTRKRWRMCPARPACSGEG